MLVIALFSWWYTVGWAQLAQRAMTRTAGMLEFFSVGLLARTLFAPFRQISVGKVQGSLDTQLRAWADRQISRAIGALVRLAVICFGLLATAIMLVVSLALLLLWPFVPVVPFLAVMIAWGIR